MNIFDNISVLFISLYLEKCYSAMVFTCLCGVCAPSCLGKEQTVSAKTPSLVALAVK